MSFPDPKMFADLAKAQDDTERADITPKVGVIFPPKGRNMHSKA